MTTKFDSVASPNLFDNLMPSIRKKSKLIFKMAAMMVVLDVVMNLNLPKTWKSFRRRV